MRRMNNNFEDNYKHKSRCELLYYIRYSENPDEMICGAPHGCCRGRKFNKAPGPLVINACPYYKEGRNKIAKIISEITPAVN